MAGPNLELFKFGLYVFFPVAVMLHYGNPEWYNQHIIPYRDKFWPPEPSKRVPHNPSELTDEIEKFKQRRLRGKEALPRLGSLERPSQST